MKQTSFRFFSRAAMLLMMLLTTQTAWAFVGGGTSADPYKIANANDLIQLATDVNGGETYSNKYFQQTAPITLTSAWTPIGTSTHPFKGHYDGGNNAISGLTVSGNYKYAGLFGYISSDRVNGSLVSNELQNINIVDCNINVGSVTNSEAGAIAGYAGQVKISDCRVSGSITGYVYACGLIGDIETNASISNCFVDVAVSGTGNQYNQHITPSVYLMAYVGYSASASGNYYHDRVGNVAVGSKESIKNSATPLYTIGAPSGLTVAATNATLTFNNNNYFATNANATLTVDDADKSITAFTATGAASSSVAANKKSATITLGSSDVTVSATLQTISGTTTDGLSWSLAQDGSGHYTQLTISGTGAMKTYGHTTDGKTTTWRTDAPWGWQLTSVTIGNGVTSISNFAFIGCQSLATVTIGTGVTTIGENAFDHCDAMTSVTLPSSVTTLGANTFKNCVNLERIDIGHDGAVSLAGNVFQNCGKLQYIVFSSPAGALANTTGNWSGLASKLRAALGNYLFLATNEGGTPAYKIATADDLRNLAAAVNDSNNGKGKTFRQTDDIDLSSGDNFEPIGYSTGFKGTYDGGKKTISGLTINGNYQSAGLFAVVDKGGTVKNVRLISPYVTSSCKSAYVAALIGYASYCTIENCLVVSLHVNATSSAIANKVGALVGYLDCSTVQNCFVISPTVSAEGSTLNGAICGYVYSTRNYPCTLTNVYYYNSDLDAIGKHENPEDSKITRVSAAHLVTPGSGVIIQTEMAADLGFSYDSDGDGTPENYWRQGAKLTLGNNAPDGYAPVYLANGTEFSGNTYTVNSTDGDVTLAATNTYTLTTYTITYNLNGGTLSTEKNSYTVESGEITLDTPTREYYTFLGWYANEGLTDPEVKTIAAGSTGDKQLWAKWGIPYIDADGNTQYCPSATVLTNSTDISNLSGGWYLVAENVSYSSRFYCESGDIHLILCDGAKMTVETNNDNVIGVSGYSLTIYAQSMGSSMGQLEAKTTSYGGKGICATGNITICGGQITATGGNFGIFAGKNVTICGGQITATGGYTGIYAENNVTLGWSNASDYIHANSYYASGTIKIADGKAFDNGSEMLSGIISHSDFKTKLDGKTLTPFNGCYSPKNLTATDIAVTTATLTWEKGNDETQWQVSWSTDGGETWISPVTVNSTQYEMTNLDPETTFQVQVVSVYGEGQYSYPKSITFTTHSASEAPTELTSNTTANTAVLSWKGFQDGYNMRYRQVSVFPEYFESYADDATLYSVWTVLDLGGGENADELGVSADAAKTSTKGFRFSSYDESSSYDQYLISPILPKGETLTFAYKSSHGTKDTFRVGYSTTTNDLSAFEWGDEINSDKEWQTFEQEIPEGAKYFAINYTGQYAYRLFIDDITINGMQAADWENKTNVTSPQTITDLTPETKYEWQVQGIVGNDVTEWSTLADFTTNYEVSYIDENGEEQTTIAHTLNGSKTMLAPGWYFVPDGVDLAYENALSCYKGDLNIILCDGAEMSVDVAEGKALFLSGNNRTLTIYGQSEGTGRLTVTGAVSEENQDGTIDVSNMIINGGIVSATSNEKYHAAIHGNVTLNRGQLTVSNDGSLALEGVLTVNGGRFMAYSGVSGIIHFNGGTFSATGVTADIYLNWTSPSDRFYAGSIYSDDIFIADGKIFVDKDGKLYQANKHGVINDYPHGKTLMPISGVEITNDDEGNISASFDGSTTTPVVIPAAIEVNEVALKREFANGKYATLMLPFSLSKEQTLKGAEIYQFEGVELENGEWIATATKADKLEANTPYLVKPVANGSLTFDLNGGTVSLQTDDSKDGSTDGSDWHFNGTYSLLEYKADGSANLSGNVYGFASTTKVVGNVTVNAGEFVKAMDGASVPPMRCYLTYKDGDKFTGARSMTRGDEDLPQSITVRFIGANGETTAIGTLNTETGEVTTDGWYTLSGHKLAGKPTTKGLYINNGKKVIIK